jgi:hypothetical protein
MFGTGGLNYLGHRRYLARSILVTSGCSLILAASLVSVLGAVGAAVTFVLAELILFAQIVRAYAPDSSGARLVRFGEPQR